MIYFRYSKGKEINSMEEKIYEAYFEACRKYYFNRHFEGRAEETEYFRGQKNILASLLGGDNDRLIKLRDMARTQAEEDLSYFSTK
jgi:hypothetical protein